MYFYFRWHSDKIDLVFFFCFVLQNLEEFNSIKQQTAVIQKFCMNLSIEYNK